MKMPAFVLIFLLLNLSHVLPVASETQNDAIVAGVLHLGTIPPLPQPNETGYWLSSDELVYTLKGSKSEASTDVVVLTVPVNLKEKTKKLKDQHVVVIGDMNCIGNWASGAYCNMLVKQIDMKTSVENKK
ncbi:MAG: hypothetical protein LLF28_02715 [Nitrospiraceae bacterium]|nr:hypothetical protein [Nitrospiraceae bacterium]